MKKLVFENEEAERDFWSKNDSANLIDWSAAKRVNYPNLRKSLKTISIRLPQDMIERLKIRANSLDIPYQSYIKMIIMNNLSQNAR